MYATTSKTIRLGFAAVAFTLGSGLGVAKLHASGDFQRHIALNRAVVILPGVAVVAKRPSLLASIDRAAARIH